MREEQRAPMGMVEELAHLAQEVIASYEARVSSVEDVIEATHEMLEAFRGQGAAMRAQLRETLARAASLRKRDFDAMMQGTLSTQERRAAQVRETMREYLQEQRALAEALKAAMARGEAERGSGSSVEPIEAIKELLGALEARREEREHAIKCLLADFRREQEEVAEALGGLLSNGGGLRIKDFKLTLRTIQARLGAGGEPMRLSRPWSGARAAGGRARSLGGKAR